MLSHGVTPKNAISFIKADLANAREVTQDRIISKQVRLFFYTQGVSWRRGRPDFDEKW
jgi:hypothetical protein